MTQPSSSLLSTHIWQQFAQRYGLTDLQLTHYQRYYEALCQANELFNITALTELEAVIAYHFSDSLELGKTIDFMSLSMIADVGTGGGFPGLVLKIKYPHLAVVLIEVNLKKVQFLQSLADEFLLQNVIVTSQDWRTFLRKTDYPLQLICSRASLHPDELLRMFKPSSPYRMAQLVYWASEQWKPTQQEQLYITKTVTYAIHDKTRRYIFFNNISNK